MFSLKLFYFKFLFIFKKAFLPNGFPHSVSADYLEYQLWDSIQAFASSIMNNLATQAVFKGVGVGDANATVLAATITWLLKDGTSIIGSLIFATFQCTKMDSYCKRWRLFADVLNDCAICIDLLSPGLSGIYFTLVQCFSGILRSLVGIAGGATRAALTQHQAKCNNLADVSAKDNSQERMVNLFALVFSLVLIPIVTDNPTLIWSLFTLFTVLHIYANYRAVSSVCLDVLNCNRLAIFFENFITESGSLAVDQVNLQENVWFFNAYVDPRDNRFNNIELVNADVATRDALLADLGRQIEVLFVDVKKRFAIQLIQHSDSSTFTLKAYLFQDMPAHRKNPHSVATSRLQIQILFAVFLINYCHMSDQKSVEENWELKAIKSLVDTEPDDVLTCAWETVANHEEQLFEAIEVNGWNLGHLLISELFAGDSELDEEEKTVALKEE